MGSSWGILPLAGRLMSPFPVPQVNIGSTKGSCRDKQVSGEEGLQRGGWAPWKSP